jgi:energy-coupling factor transporter ATP-binding protein EcfA2
VTVDGVDLATLPTHRTAERVVLGVQDPAGQLSMVADSVYEEVAFGPANLAVPHGELIERVEGALERVGIADLARRDPRRLSGGQQQLVVIAGLLAMASDYLILDEPLAHLDALSTGRILDALDNVAANGTAVLIAEHRTAALLRIAASMAVIEAGRIVREGPTNEVLGDRAVIDLGIEEPAALRLERLIAAAAPGAQP